MIHGGRNALKTRSRHRLRFWILLVFLPAASVLGRNQAPNSVFAFFEPQESAQPSQEKHADDQPKIKVNVLNTCSPAKEDQAILQSALSKVSGSSSLSDDFEMSRGRSTSKEQGTSKYVRLRREFVPQSPVQIVQYSISSDVKTTIETLVFRMREPKDFLELSIEDRVSADAASPALVLDTDTPAARIRLERLGKNSIVLARCESADQSAYEPLFTQASDLTARYRKALGLRTAFRSDIGWLTGSAKSSTAADSHKQP
jgi:hypothetical protein